MPPDLGQGGCSALGDGVILARCLADVLLENSTCQRRLDSENEDEYRRTKKGLDNYAEKRTWRVFDLICTGYMLGWIQEYLYKIVYFEPKFARKGTTKMEVNADIVIVGAGISGLATALALHRLGIKSLVLESSNVLRAAGITITAWTNAWRVLDALGIADSLRQQHGQIFGGDDEVRCLKRKALLEALAKDLPSGTIRYSSKVVSIEESGFSKLVHLDNGSTLKTKVLIGCDGVNSVVTKWLGFNKPTLLGRSAIRGCAYYVDGHSFEPKFDVLVGNGVRFGVVPCDHYAVYWFLTGSLSAQGNSTLQENQLKLKQFVLNKLGKVSDHIRAVVEDTKVEEIACASLGYRPPLEVLFGNISKDNVSVAGDACHLMTPDLAQGGCLALEDGIVLARCLADALLENEDEYKYERIKHGLNNYAEKRRWRAVDLIYTGCMLGWIQESEWFGVRYLREKLLSHYLSELPLKKADFDPKQLVL
ncbi:Monooxygenase 3 [Bienertia sinuspersici]